MAVLLGLPPELLSKIAEFLHADYRGLYQDDGSEHLYSLAKKCTTLYAVARPLLFRTSLSPGGGRPAVLAANHVGPYIQAVQASLILGSFLRLCILRPGTISFRGGSKKEQLDHLKRICDAVGNLLGEYAPGIRELHIPYSASSTFLQHPWPQLKVLSISTTDFSLGIGSHRPWEYELGLTEGPTSALCHTSSNLQISTSCIYSPHSSLACTVWTLRNPGLVHSKNSP